MGWGAPIVLGISPHSLNVVVPSFHSLDHFPIVIADLIPIRPFFLSLSLPHLRSPLPSTSAASCFLQPTPPPPPPPPFPPSPPPLRGKRAPVGRGRGDSGGGIGGYSGSLFPSFLPSFNASISLATAAAPRSVTDVAPAYFLGSEARFLCSCCRRRRRRRHRRPPNGSGPPRVWFIQLSLTVTVLAPSHSPKGGTASAVRWATGITISCALPLPSSLPPSLPGKRLGALSLPPSLSHH